MLDIDDFANRRCDFGRSELPAPYPTLNAEINGDTWRFELYDWESDTDELKHRIEEAAHFFSQIWHKILTDGDDHE